MKAKPTGPAENSATRDALIDATEELMREEGYAAISSRRIGARAGVKAPLIHYYFETMDDLYLALFRRLSNAWLRGMEAALASDQPLRTLWDHELDPEVAKLITEFLALAIHRKVVRDELARWTAEARIIQTEGIERFFKSRGIAPPVPMDAVSVLLGSVPFRIAVETMLGVSMGHAEAVSVIQGYLRGLEEQGAEATPPISAHAGE